MKRLGSVLLLMLAVISLMVAGCNGDGDATPAATATPEATATMGISETATPEAIATAAPDETATPGGPGPGEPTDPVSFNELIPFLPDPPAGWDADEPFGITQTVMEWSWSQALRDYYSQTTDESVTVFIYDSAYYYEFSWYSLYAYAIEWESTEGYSRSVTVDGYPAWEIYSNPDSYSLMVLVADRFMVAIYAETKATLDMFSDLIDYDGIAALD
ncbi:MAG: hypothetical protein SVO26_04075 [Chloroflexota bacterium]|nr:hypothetical protein [Chloroflexota bacterium]